MLNWFHTHTHPLPYSQFATGGTHWFDKLEPSSPLVAPISNIQSIRPYFQLWPTECRNAQHTCHNSAQWILITVSCWYWTTFGGAIWGLQLHSLEVTSRLVTSHVCRVCHFSSSAPTLASALASALALVSASASARASVFALASALRNMVGIRRRTCAIAQR